MEGPPADDRTIRNQNPPQGKPSSRVRPRSTVVNASWYASAVAREALFSPEEERAAALEIRSREIAFWSAFLSHGRAFQHLATLELSPSGDSEPEQQVSRADIAGLSRSARAALASGDRAASSAAAGALAAAIRERDRGRGCMKGALQWAARLCDEPGDSAPFSGGPIGPWRLRVQRAYEAQSRAKQRFARANLRLVIIIARRHDHGQMPLLDLIQEGNLGLMIAIERFDASRGFCFSTYASWWIRHAIRRGIAGIASTVRIPVHRRALAQQINGVTRRALACTGSEPTAREIAAQLGVSERTVQNLQERPNAANLSLDRSVGAPEGATFLDLLVDETSPADEALDEKEWRRTLGALLASLKPIEARVLRRRFGLDGDDSVTLDSVGGELSLTRERVRQIQVSALARLRRSLGPVHGA